MSTPSPTQSFTLLCWNVHKEMGRSVFDKTLSSLIKSYEPHLLLLQEAVIEPYEILSNYNIASVKNIDFTKKAYGVLTASRFDLLCHTSMQTDSRELYCMTKKSLLVTAYSLEGGKILHVVNLHAINFVSHRVFLYELERLKKHLQQIDTPLIVAGDFNTWSVKREKHLEDFAASLGLKKADVKDAHYIKNHWKKPLDHIFYRGVDLKEARAINMANVSDHNPIWANFTF